MSEYIKAIEDLIIETDECQCEEEKLKEAKLEQLQVNFEEVSRRYLNNLLPHVILSDEEKAQLEANRLLEQQKNNERNALRQKLLQKFTVEQFKEAVLFLIDQEIES
jgi:hypothetical protein